MMNVVSRITVSNRLPLFIKILTRWTPQQEDSPVNPLSHLLLLRRDPRHVFSAVAAFLREDFFAEDFTFFEELGFAALMAALRLARYAVRLRRLISFLYCLPII